MHFFLEALKHNPLLIASLLASISASVISGIIGSYVVVKRIVFIAGSISHSILSGVGFAIWLDRTQGISWLSPLYGALMAGIVAAWIIGWTHLNYRQREDSVIAVLWSVGMAIGIIFISQTPGFNVELTNFLIGNIVWVSKTDLYTLFSVDLIVIMLIFCLHKRFLVICFDEDQARLQGIHIERFYFLLLTLISLSIVLLMQVVGIVLVMAMLTIPPVMANLFTHRLSIMMSVAILINIALCLAGHLIAFHLDWPIGATIGLLAGISYGIVLISKRSFDKFLSRFSKRVGLYKVKDLNKA